MLKNYLRTELAVFIPVELEGYPPIEFGGIGPIPGGRIPPGPFIGGGGIIWPGVGVIPVGPPENVGGIGGIPGICGRFGSCGISPGR